MPVTRNPGDLHAGHGKKAPNALATRPALTGAGLAGPGPNVGGINEALGVELPGALALNAVHTHLHDPKAAHAASAVEHDGHPDILYSSNVEGALDELIGTVMKRPPMLGQWSPDTTFSGITDWGYLKLRDSDLGEYGALTYTDPTVQNAQNVYPYLLRTIGPPIDTEFDWPMADPRTDWQFNSGMTPGPPGTFGTGYGRSHIGAYTRDGELGPAPLPVFRSARLYPRPGEGVLGLAERVPVTISGTLFPADRGVLALLHFNVPRGASVKASFLVQPLITDHTMVAAPQGRVVAALLLGNGILGDKCQDSDYICDDAHLCDGDPGGIFGVGTDSDDNYDPFQFPGRATGQYGLHEIHKGVNDDAGVLRTPWNDLDADLAPGTSRAVDAVIPAPGQVRLGTDPDANGGAVVDNGIPILGGTTDFYAVPPTPQTDSLTLNIHGDALVGDSNFFRYRLPVLKDYTEATGLKWTPRGEVASRTQETRRFFLQAAPSNTTVYEDGSPVLAYWRTAGLYDGFDEDYWVWQVARYRQTFLMPSTKVITESEEVGTYVLIHFKQESDFERCARDGEFPWTAGGEYEVYGMALVDNPEHVDNLANSWLPATEPVAPDGPAPAYGFAANPWHNLRNRIFLDPYGTVLPADSNADFLWETTATPVTDAVVWTSGVAYFTPRQSDDGSSAFVISAANITLAAGFWTSYRTDSLDLTGVGGIGPADVASQNPVLVATAPWGYEANSLAVPVNPDSAHGYVPSTDYVLPWRIEVPFTHLGSTGGLQFSDTNAPLVADPLDLVLPSDILLLGDAASPSFSRDAAVRVHFRRPLNHTDPDDTNLPWTLFQGHGTRLVPIAPVAAGLVLMHTTQFDKTNRVGRFGNYVAHATGGPPNLSYIELFTSAKAVSERFLDETHRYVTPFPASLAVAPYTAQAVASLDGPGMAGWAGGPFELPVHIGRGATPWGDASYLLMEHHIADLTAGVTPLRSLQVAGLPERNPHITSVNTMPFPSSGVLIYPQTDFGTGYYPEQGTHVTAAQPDYSAAVGVREYVRAFDAAFNQTGYVLVPANGRSELTLRFDGITLDDFWYAAPGPGGLAANRIAISLKVPGLTTWMDVGRQDGAGPSKQDNLLDGAGCVVTGTETYTFTDPESGYKGCYVKCHVGPVASLFENTGGSGGYTDGVPASLIGEAPVLVRVQMDVGAVGYSLERIAFTPGVFEPGSMPGAPSEEVRGLISMSVVHPNDDLIAPDGTPTPPAFAGP